MHKRLAWQRSVLAASLGFLATQFCIRTLHAQQPGMLETVLFDFEDGVDGWSGNPWKGGECLFRLSGTARFGGRSMYGWYEGGAGDGGNIISPTLPSSAAWRKHDWQFISLWLKGDGSASSVSLILVDDGPSPNTFSDNLDLDSTNWCQFILSPRAFYNSGRRGCNMSGLRRLYFGGSPPQSFRVDRISLLPNHEYACLDQIAEQGALPFEKPIALEYAQGEYGILLTSKTNPGESSGQVTVSLATEEGSTDAESFAYTFGPGVEPVTVPLSVNVTADTRATLEVRVVGRATHWVRFRFPASAREPFPGPSDPAVFPLPKTLTKRSGHMRITPQTRIVSADLQDPEVLNGIDILDRALQRRYGLRLERASMPGTGTRIVLRKQAVDLPDEGYYLNISTESAEVRAADGRALSYGIYSLLQVLADSTHSAFAPRARCVDIADWPNLKTRAAMIPLPVTKWGYPQNPHAELGAFLEFLDEALIRNKLNTIILHVRNAYPFAAVPGVASTHAWKRADLETLQDFCRRRFVDIVPMVDSMGHSNWLLIPYPQYAWHNSTDTVCTCNPATWTVMTAVFDELIDIFEPKMFHIGMDEVNWDGDPDAPRCGCDDFEKWEQLGLWVKRLHDWLAVRGIRTMMWGDKLIEGHGGGAPHLTKRAVPLIPKDVIIVNWSSSVHGSSAIFNKEYGFTDVMPGNSYGHDIFQSPYISGNVASMWIKRPWISQTDESGSQSYSYLGLIQSAEFSWNVNRSRSMWSLSTSYLASREATALRKTALLPAPCASTATRPVDIQSAVNSTVGDAPAGPAAAAGVPFTLLPGGACVRAAPGTTHTIPWQGTAAALYFLHADELPSDGAARAAFLLRWRDIDTLWGIELGRYEIVYEDNTTAALPIAHSWNILPRRLLSDIRPHAYRVLGTYRLPGDSREEPNALYAAQWVNPYPARRIKQIRIVRNDAEAAVQLFAVAAAYCAAGFSSGSVTRQVASGTDDAEESAVDGGMDLSSSDLELIHESGSDDQVVGLRFRNLTIPQGATILNAYVQFTTDETCDERVSLRIRAQAIDDAPGFRSESRNIRLRAKTAACVPWLPSEWDTAGEASPAQRTRDISAVVQEVVNRPGWTSGNAMVLIIEGGYGRRTAEAYEGDPRGAAVLHVCYATRQTVPSDFAAYNDLGWFTGQSAGNITTYTTTNGFPGGARAGALVDFHTGEGRDVALTVHGGGGVHESQGANAAAGTHADAVFGGKVDCRGTISYGEQDLTMTVSGLDPNARYELALYCDRNGSSYVGPDARYHCGTLSGAESFANAGTPGVTRLTAAIHADTTLYNAGHNADTGYLTRFTGIDPGRDGEITLTIACDTDHAYYPYANALMIRTYATAAGKGGPWAYRKGTTETPPSACAWQAVDFDDSAWLSGDAPFGYSSDPDEGPFGTTLDDMRANYSTLFLRREFNVAVPALVAEATLWTHYDDGVILWVNGQEVVRQNVPGSPGTFLPHSGLAVTSSEPTSWHRVLSGAALPALRRGKNVLAAHVFNSGLSSSDLTFDAELTFASHPLSPDEDADADLLADEWEQAAFAAGDLSADPNADPDSDGFANIEEYVIGGNPERADRALAVMTVVTNGRVTVWVPTVPARGAGYAGKTRYYAIEQCAFDNAPGAWSIVPGCDRLRGTGTPLSYTLPDAVTTPLWFRARAWLE
ncbi:MAG: beta-N-acetylhexosaminidase [Kiritimatiellae bacterium]|nr:beta-N-acetylhexosaminidase [Kiritimatiellia bacterium]